MRGAWCVAYIVAYIVAANSKQAAACLDSSLRLTRTGAWYVLQGEGRTDGRTDIGRSVCQYRVVVSGRHAFEFEQQVSGVVEGGAAGGRVGGPA